ncbi:MAG: helix-turn-helix transcriptional regulator [Clostridia bacterium]|nr:helix-turn-helix transcriptional regulator [Clostridia bacterium]
MLKDVIKTEVFENYMREHNLTKTQFCGLCGINVVTYNRIISRQNFRILALFKIAKVIKVEVWQMFKD